MQWLARISVKRAVFASVLILLVLVLGAAGYVDLGVDRFPKIDFPIAVIVTRMPGADPQEVETEVTERVEEAVNTISGIDELNSITSEGISQVVVQFVLEKNLDVAVQEVRDKVQAIIPRLPRSVETPVVNKIDPDAIPVITLALKANRPVREVTERADKLVKPLLENLSGVGDVTIVGGRERQVHVWLDPIRMKSAGVSALDVQRAIVSQNVSVPSGALEAGPSRVGLRFKARIARPGELEQLVLRQVQGHAVTLGDVARVEDGEAEAESYASIDGAQAVLLSVRKQSGTNTVALAHAVRARMTEIQPRLPTGFRLEVLRDSSEVTQTSVNAVKEHLALGAVFAALVVLLFLGNWRTTIISAVAIPVSIIGTFALMSWMGFTLNTITLLALALAVGIVIDDAIVVLENIYRFIHEKKVKPFPAAIQATKEIGLAVLATTMSLIAVFLPMAFMSGVVGRFLKSFGWTMAFSIGVSMLVSFTLTPMLAARWLRAPVPGERKPLMERLSDRVNAPIEHAYAALLRWVMRHRWVVVVGALGALASLGPLAKAVAKGFLPINDEAQFQVTMRTPEGTSLEATRLIADRVARDIRALPDTVLTLTTIGDNNDRAQNAATIYVKLKEPEQRKVTQDEWMGRVRTQITSKLPKDLRVQVSLVSPFSGGLGSTAAVQYRVSGPDLAQLGVYAQRLIDETRKVPGAVDVDSNLVIGRPEARLLIDRARAADLGVEVSDIALTLQLAVGGLEVSTYEEAGEQYPVRMRAERGFRQSVEDLSLLTVPSRTQGPVPLLEVARVERGEGPSVINRSNRQRQFTLLANTAPGVGAGQVIDGIEKVIAAMKLERGYTSGPIGQSKEIGRTMKNFLLAFLLAFVFMYLVLAAQFESWLHPITILLSLPLTVPFALISLLIFRQQLDIFSMLGLLVLFGVVKKNAILQVDHTLQLRRQGVPRLEAIIQGSRDRLRPILMTTAAFVAGMVPLAISVGVGAGNNRATAGVVVGGQVLSLLLTLVATPVAYSLFDDVSSAVARWSPFGRRDPVASGELEVRGEDEEHGEIAA